MRIAPLQYYWITPLWKLSVLRLYLNPFNPVFKGKRVTVTLYVTQHCWRQKANSAFPTQGFFSAYRNCSTFQHLPTQWLRVAPEGPGLNTCDLSGCLCGRRVSAINRNGNGVSLSNIWSVSQDGFTEGSNAPLHVTYHNTCQYMKYWVAFITI